MLQFCVVLGAVMPLLVMAYLRRGAKREGYYKRKYRNPYLAQYLELPLEADKVEVYKTLAQAVTLLLKHEQEVNEEMRYLRGLFLERMVSSSLWNDLKAVKEEIEIDKMTVDAEISRYKEMLNYLEVPKAQKVKEAPLPPVSRTEALQKDLYRKLQESRRAQTESREEKITLQKKASAIIRTDRSELG